MGIWVSEFGVAKIFTPNYGFDDFINIIYNKEIRANSSWCHGVSSSVKMSNALLQWRVSVVCVVLAEVTVQQLLRALCSNNMTPKQHLEQQQALFKQFAEILDFVLKFDDLKVSQS